MALSLPPPPTGQSITNLEVKKDKDQKVTEVTPSTNWFWSDWFFRLQTLLNQLIPAGGAQAAIQFKDEGSNLGTSGTVTSISVVGTDLIASRAGDALTLTHTNPTITLTGDVTGSGTPSITTTLATVNATTGTFGSSTQVGQFTVNGKGLITAASNVAISASGIGAQAAVQFQDEGGNLGTSGTATVVNFTGTAIAATRASNTITVDSDQMKFSDILAFAAAQG